MCRPKIATAPSKGAKTRPTRRTTFASSSLRRRCPGWWSSRSVAHAGLPLRSPVDAWNPLGDSAEDFVAAVSPNRRPVTVMAALPSHPMRVTRSPTDAPGTRLTSTIIMSMHTAPTTGARRPRQGPRPREYAWDSRRRSRWAGWPREPCASAATGRVAYALPAATSCNAMILVRRASTGSNSDAPPPPTAWRRRGQARAGIA